MVSVVAGKCERYRGDLAHFVDDRFTRRVGALRGGVHDGDGLEIQIAGHARVELGVLDRSFQVGRDHGNRVAVYEAADAKFDTVRAAHPLGGMVARVSLGIGVDLGLRHRGVVVLLRDSETERELWSVGIWGKYRCYVLGRV